jgi:hypothetical protein
LTQSPSLVGSWNDGGQTTVLMRAPLEGQVEDALAASGSIRRAATVRDLYFAFRERA